MSSDAENRIRSELANDERLLWSGQPRQGFMLRAWDLVLIPLSLAVTAAPILACGGIIAEGVSPFVSLFLIPFVLLGAYFVVGRLFADIRIRKRTYYAVTSERAIIVIEGFFRRIVRSFQLDQIADLTIEESQNGRGTILFGQVALGWRIEDGFSWTTILPKMREFESVENADAVFETILRAQRAARKKSSA